MEPLGFDRIVVLGHGLIGGSIALAVAERLPDASVVTLDRGDDIQAAVDADLVVLAAPIDQIVQLLRSLAHIVSTSTLITDTGSTKAAIVRAAEGMRFIGGHPIAGAATAGRASARPDLFAGRPWVLTPGPMSQADDLARLSQFIQRLGSTPHVVEAEEHDRLFAFVSHLPQLVVSALMDVVGSQVGQEGLTKAGAGLRDTTRLAGSPPDIWVEIVRSNHAHIREAIDLLATALKAMRDDPHGEALTRTFESAARWRSLLEDGRYNH